MSKHYIRGKNDRRFVRNVTLFVFLFLVSGTLSAQVKDSTITGIYTDFNSYWPTSTTNNSAIQPDTSHNLLAFTFRGNTYSTGVDDAILNTKLGSANYSKQTFKALPVNTIAGSVTNGSSTYIATASKNDGNPNGFGYTTPFPVIHIADVLTDGKNGLDLGTGVTNLPTSANISFVINNLSAKASTDTVPDLVFTQIADPSTSLSDVIYFYDANGNVVGNKKLVNWSTVSKLGTYKLDLYRLTYESCNTSTINGTFETGKTRDIRMVAFLLTEFGITNADSAAKVKGIQINPSGVSDQAFIAYNTRLLNIDVPEITTQPVALQTFCNNTTTSATFSVVASGVNLAYQWRKNGTNIAGATSAAYTATGLTLADTANNYTVRITNQGGAVISTVAKIKYTIVTQPAAQYVATGTPATFTVKASGATGFQWYKDGVAISGAILPSYTISSAPLNLSGSTYSVDVSTSNGTCTSNAATLTVENLPVINTQPQAQVLCNNSATTTTFSVAATATSALTYQWYKGNTAISGATASSYSPTGLTKADTLSTYKVTVTSAVGSVTSNAIGFKYLILSQPAPATAYLATGNTITFTPAVSAAATVLQWKKDGTNITNANGLSFTINTVTTASAGNYTLSVAYAGGSCLTNASALTTSTVLYSKAAGNMNDPATWGVQTNGLGSTPVDFTRSEHTFIVSNRDTLSTTANLTIAGTLDAGDGITSITGGTTLEAGRIIRSLTKGTLAGTATSGLTVHGNSDLYFDTAKKILQTLTINTDETVTLHTALDMTAGSGHGIVKVLAGAFNTGDSLTLKSDSLGTAGVGNSAGDIIGKVTVERYIPAHRAWRLFCSPVAAQGAPSINAAWQEGATSSTDNPHPGYGTHITYGAEADGFDRNPQKSFSIKMRNSSGAWVGIPPTKTTLVTDQPAYFLFVRGNRSYDITSTTNHVTPLPTIIRTTGSLNQKTSADMPVDSGSFALINNPYASPVDFESVYAHSPNVAHRIRVWNPNLGGTYGVGAYVTVYWTGSGYNTVPAMPGANKLRFIQANEGFFVEGADKNAHLNFEEADKDTANLLLPFGRLTEEARAKLEVNLNVFNDDNTTGIADGIAYLFNNEFNNAADGDDIRKIGNTNENLSISSNKKLFTVEERAEMKKTDTLQLNLTGTKTGNYQLEFIPNQIGCNLYLLDKYLNTSTPISGADTSRITIAVNTSIAASKAADRFVIITKTLSVLPVTFTNIKATVKAQAVQIDWQVASETGIRYYEVERSDNGRSFSKIGEVNAGGSKEYGFTDVTPVKGVNYYRIRSVSLTGEISYTTVADVTFSSDGKSYIAVYPNPFTGNHGVIAWHNKPTGKYTLQLTSQTGETVFTKTLFVTDGNSVQPLQLPQSLAKGAYQLTVTGAGTTEVIKLVSL